MDSAEAATREGDAWTAAVEEAELLASDGADHDQELFLSGFTTPVLFASAISNFGVAMLLDTLVELGLGDGRISPRLAAGLLGGLVRR